MENCIFCKIVRKEILTEPVYEDDFVIAFPDIHPVTPGHTLLIPKTHYQWFYEVPEELAGRWFSAAQHIVKQLKEKYAADYVHLSIVGKDVPHAHMHLIPKKLTDNTKN